MPTPIAKTSPQKTIPRRMSRRYILNQCWSSLSIMVNLACVGLKDVQRVAVAGDKKSILCVHYYADSR